MSHKNTVLKHIRRSPYQSLAAIFMTSITFFIVSVFVLVVLGASSMLAFFESRPQVTAFFKDATELTQVESLKTEINTTVSVEEMRYLSKDDALGIYRKQNEGNPLLLEMVTADILPASLEVSAKNVDDLETIAGVMQKNTFIEEVVFQKDVIDTLRKWVGGVRITGIVLSSLLIFASLTTIVMILGLKFTARKAEINTLSLLGATTWYIRGPFVTEGIIYAVVGSILGWGLSYISLLYLTPNLVEFLQEITILPVPLWVMASVLGGEIVLACLIGAFASLIATRRYGR
ncbi:ABC transporter permease [Candidatus Woesebacteria bacterium]|nr:ABC transporter permease [Candidatus Woesebacteria bacterium]